MQNKKILYITRNGMLEALGQSQVLSYLRGLSIDYQITLISFEKETDLSDKEAFEKVTNDCLAHNIRWLPQRFYHRPKILAPAWSMLVFLFLCFREVFTNDIKLIHARSYIPAAIALIVNIVKGTPFIFDMRALWPEEMITAGRLKRHSLMHKAIVLVERSCLKRASTVVSLTHAAVDYLSKEYPKELANQNIVIIPTCADLNRFIPADKTKESSKVYGCLGSVLSGWFKIDWLSKLFQALAKREPDAHFEIVTKDNPEHVRLALATDKDLQSRLKIYGVSPFEVHKVVQNHNVSIMLYAGGEVSELGRSPTRMAEVLGCGLPVIANHGVGDVAQIIEKYKVGVLVADQTDTAIQTALDKLDLLMSDPELPMRCRDAAETLFSLETGTTMYRNIYNHITTARLEKYTKLTN